MRQSRWTGLLAACVVAASTLAAGAASGPAAASPPRPFVPDSAPRWTAQARALGEVPAGSVVDFGIMLRMRDGAGAAATVQRISEPGNASYGHWLSARQFRARYGPPAKQVAVVREWLLAQGLTVRKVLPSGMYIEVRGTAAQVARTFSTTLRSYAYLGRTVRANTSPLRFPTLTPAAIIAA